MNYSKTETGQIDDPLHARIAKFDQIVIAHTDIKYAVAKIAKCISWSAVSREPRGIVLTGLGGMGKTTVCKAVLKKFEIRDIKEDGEYRRHVPAFYASIPASSSIKDLTENLLEGMGDPFPKAGSAPVRTKRLQTLLKNCGTKVILLDEFHHIINPSTPGQRQSELVCNWIRTLINETKVMVCLVGIPACEAIIDRNDDDQMRRRFADRVRLSDLQLGTADNPGDFVAYMKTLMEQSQSLIDIASFPDASFIFMAQLWAATGGRPGFIALLMKDAIEVALVDGSRNHVTLGDFAEAFQNGCMIEISRSSKNPFEMSNAQLQNEFKNGTWGRNVTSCF